MYQSVRNILNVEFFAACSQVPFVIPVALKISIDSSYQSVAANVKLPLFVKQRLFNVLLDYIRSLLAIDMSVANNLSY